MKSETILAAVVAVLCGVAGFFLVPGRELALVDIVLVKAVSVSVLRSWSTSWLPGGSNSATQGHV